MLPLGDHFNRPSRPEATRATWGDLGFDSEALKYIGEKFGPDLYPVIKTNVLPILDAGSELSYSPRTIAWFAATLRPPCSRIESQNPNGPV